MGLLIRNASILLRRAEPLELLYNTWLLIEKGRIAGVGGTGDSPPMVSDSGLDAEGCLVVPGLIDAHYHSIENYSKGLNDGYPLEKWLLNSYSGAGLEPRDYYLVALLGCVEMLKNGITSVVDHLYGHSLNSDNIYAVLQAYVDSGIRAMVAISYADRALDEYLPYATSPHDQMASAVPTLTEIETVVRDCLVGWHDPTGRVNLMLGPSAPHRCSSELWTLTRMLADSYGLGIHTHLLETHSQAKTANRLWGCSAIEFLDRIGVLRGDTSLVHAVWVDSRDLDTIQQRGAAVVHCPRSNLRLGSGIAPVPEILDRGVDVALGTDGADTNGMHNLFEEMRAAALIQRSRVQDPNRWLSSQAVLQASTKGGAVVMLAPQELGAVICGMRADLVLLDLNTSTFVPMNNVLNQLVYNENGMSVRTVIVGGSIVVEDGRFQAVNESALLEEIRCIHAKRGIHIDRVPPAEARSRRT